MFYKQKYLFYVDEVNDGNIKDNEESYKSPKINILCILLTSKYLTYLKN
jgi:hypothetical protein